MPENGGSPGRKYNLLNLPLYSAGKIREYPDFVDMEGKGWIAEKNQRGRTKELSLNNLHILLV